MILKIVIKKIRKIVFFRHKMSLIEQLETLRTSELYDDCKTLVNKS